MQIKPEDYLEPGCPFCTNDAVKPIELRRMLERLDALLARNDTAAAERHLDFWRLEALQGRDRRGLLCVENERMGLFRKLGKQEQALAAAEAALALVAELELQDSVTGATSLLNAATVYKAFAQPQKALALYGQAQTVYERELAPDDPRLGGLYNNMALALTELGRFAQARDAYERALAVMQAAGDAKPELAITELNLADLAEAEYGPLDAEAEIEARLDRAQALLDAPDNPRDGNYAFVCEKCASAFSYHGRFLYAQELARRSEEIYAGT